MSQNELKDTLMEVSACCSFTTLFNKPFIYLYSINQEKTKHRLQSSRIQGKVFKIPFQSDVAKFVSECVHEAFTFDVRQAVQTTSLST